MTGKHAFVHHERVRYADTDQMGIVYHGRYFEFFEAARTELMRQNGMDYRFLEETGLSLPVVEAQCRYRRSVTYDEWIGIETRLIEVSRARLQLEYRVVGEDGSLRADGYTVHCFMKEGRPTRAPNHIVTFFDGFKLKSDES